MKNATFAIVVAALSVATTGSAQNDFTIQGRVDGMADGTMIYLNKAVDGELSPLDSVKLKNGSFTFKGKTEDDVPVRYVSYKLPKYEKWTDFFLESGTITMSLSKDKDSVIGTQYNNLYQDIKDRMFVNSTKQDSIHFRLGHDALQEEQKSSMEKELQDLRKEMTGIYRSAMSDNITNPVGIMMFKLFYKKNTPTANEELLKRIPEKYQNDETIVNIRKTIKNALATMAGKQFVDFTLQTPEGNDLKLSDVVGKGKVVLVDFWASWCGPCRASMPQLKEIYNKFKDKGFEIVGVSLDNKKEAWTGAIKTLELPWKQMSDLKGWNCEGARLYDVRAIPHTVLIDKDGTIVARMLSAEELETKLSQLCE